MAKARDWLKGISEYYDVVVIGSGLAGLTGANHLAKNGHSVLLLEHHYQYGGLATWFKRKGGHIFDISLHGFPIGMIKSCRKYWTREIADSIVQLKNVRFINPQFNIWTTFDRNHFTSLMHEKFKIARSKVEDFFNRIKAMNFYDDENLTTRELFEEFFPGRDDIHRLLLEPIAYANGSTMEDPAITFGIVFGNFMSKGVYTFKGGTDTLINKMVFELRKNGVELRKRALVENVVVADGEEKPRIIGVKANGRLIGCKAVLSNANLKSTIMGLVGRKHFKGRFLTQAARVRVNSSSCQVYIGLKEGAEIPNIGDLVFTSDARDFSMDELTDINTSSRTFSVYYPDTRPHLKCPRIAIVASLNSRWKDWSALTDEQYRREKKRLCSESVASLERFIPDIREKIDHLEAATPRTINHYTRHIGGTSFGTKFEGLKISMDLPREILGLFHAGSVGIIMSGWLGTINYGIIIADKIDRMLFDLEKQRAKQRSLSAAAV